MSDVTMATLKEDIKKNLIGLLKLSNQMA